MSDLPCDHCALPAPDGIAIHDQGKRFCCHGCRIAHGWIESAGLSDFYRLRQAPGTPPDARADFSVFDHPTLAKRYLRSVDGQQEAHLLVEGIHCAACIWLNEKVLRGLPGVTAAQVNFSTQRAVVRFDPKQLGLSDILFALNRIGYRARPYDAAQVEQLRKKRRRDLLIRMSVAAFGAGNVMLVSVALYAGYFSGIDAQLKTFFHWITLLLATPVYFYGGWPFFTGAWRGLRAGTLNMDLPIALGATITYFYSCVMTVTGQGEVYFDSVTMFLFFLLLGRFLETMARGKAAESTERLLQWEPDTATVMRDGRAVVVPVEEVLPGETVSISPGERVSVDGVVLSGDTCVDESMLTGESLPIRKGVGDQLLGGSLNGDGTVLVQAQRVGEGTVMAEMIRLTERVQSERGGIQRLADRAAAWFVGIILLLAAATFLYWLPSGVGRALEITVALLIITCPCALGLATPAAMVVASGAAAREGLVVKGGEALERLARVNHLILDKTGTLTEGRLAVVRVVPAAGVTEEVLLRLAAAVEKPSEHPVGKALVRQVGAELPQVTHFRNHAGLGVSGEVEGMPLLVGRPGFVGEALGRELAVPEEPLTWVAVAAGGAVLGMVGLSDRLKEDAPAAVAALRGMGITLSILSGDRQAVVAVVAREVGIADARGDLLPGGKETEVARRMALGERVAMVGDGVNDAPALARAFVAMTVGGASGVSVQVADAALLNDRLESVPRLVGLARRTMGVIRQNIFFSLLYNLTVIPLAVGGYLLPVVAAIAMPLSSLLVVGNALRLRKGLGG